MSKQGDEIPGLVLSAVCAMTTGWLVMKKDRLQGDQLILRIAWKDKCDIAKD